MHRQVFGNTDACRVVAAEDVIAVALDFYSFSACGKRSCVACVGVGRCRREVDCTRRNSGFRTVRYGTGNCCRATTVVASVATVTVRGVGGFPLPPSGGVGGVVPSPLLLPLSVLPLSVVQATANTMTNTSVSASKAINVFFIDFSFCHASKAA